MNNQRKMYRQWGRHFPSLKKVNGYVKISQIKPSTISVDYKTSMH